MTIDIAQAISIEIEFLVPDWRQTLIDREFLVKAPKAFRADLRAFAQEVSRIADFICYAKSRDLVEIAPDRFRLSSAMKGGDGFIVEMTVA